MQANVSIRETAALAPNCSLSAVADADTGSDDVKMCKNGKVSQEHADAHLSLDQLRTQLRQQQQEQVTQLQQEADK